MHTYKTTLAALFLAFSANAATYDRPAGGYTPTNTSANIVKYQNDSANHVAISSVKIDGDFNKAYQALNELDSRSAPSVVGHANQFLTNNGAQSFWGLVQPAGINSASSNSGMVLQSNGTGTSAFGLLTTSSFPDNGVAGIWQLPTITLNTAGMVTSVTTAQNVSLTSLSLSGTLLVSSSAVFQSGVSTTSINATSINAPGTTKAYAVFNGVGGCTVTSGYNVSGCVRVGTGQYSVSLTTPTTNANYAVNCNVSGSKLNAGYAGSYSGEATITSSSFPVAALFISGGSLSFTDASRVSCVVTQ